MIGWRQDMSLCNPFAVLHKKHANRNTRCIFGMLLLFPLLLSGCSGEHYTEDIKQEYEEEAFAAAESYLDGIGASGDSATMSLLAPDGVSRCVEGRFFLDGQAVQYVYDGDAEILWAGHTKYGFTYKKAVSYLGSQIETKCRGTGLYGPEVSSVSWFIPYTEYRYEVHTENGNNKVASKVPSVWGVWLHRPFFQWDMTDDEVYGFLDEVLHGAPDTVSDLSVEVHCDNFDAPDVQAELQNHKLMSACSGIRSVFLYEGHDTSRYYLQEVQDNGTVSVTYHEQTVTPDGDIKWRSSEVPFSEGEP